MSLDEVRFIVRMRDMAKHGTSPDQKQEKLQAISSALENCISEKGYAATTLTDISLQARMSPSHIRYYFDGGIDSILEYYFDSLCDGITEDVTSIGKIEDPNQWLDNFVEYYVNNDKRGLRITMEIFGLAVHNPRLFEIKVRYDKRIQKILESYFKRAGCIDGMTPSEAAMKIRALDTGVKIESIFDNKSKLKTARKIVADEMRRLSGKL